MAQRLPDNVAAGHDARRYSVWSVKPMTLPNKHLLSLPVNLSQVRPLS